MARRIVESRVKPNRERTCHFRGRYDMDWRKGARQSLIELQCLD